MSCFIILGFVRHSRILAGIWELGKKKTHNPTPTVYFSYLFPAAVSVRKPPRDFVLLIRMVGYLLEADISKIQTQYVNGSIWGLTLLEEIEPYLKVTLYGVDQCV